eukprot:g75635.t1
MELDEKKQQRSESTSRLLGPPSPEMGKIPRVRGKGIDPVKSAKALKLLGLDKALRSRRASTGKKQDDAPSSVFFHTFTDLDAENRRRNIVSVRVNERVNENERLGKPHCDHCHYLHQVPEDVLWLVLTLLDGRSIQALTVVDKEIGLATQEFKAVWVDLAGRDLTLPLDRRYRITNSTEPRQAYLNVVSARRAKQRKRFLEEQEAQQEKLARREGLRGRFLWHLMHEALFPILVALVGPFLFALLFFGLSTNTGRVSGVGWLLLPLWLEAVVWSVGLRSMWQYACKQLQHGPLSPDSLSLEENDGWCQRLLERYTAGCGNNRDGQRRGWPGLRQLAITFVALLLLQVQAASSGQAGQAAENNSAAWYGGLLLAAVWLLLVHGLLLFRPSPPSRCFLLSEYHSWLGGGGPPFGGVSRRNWLVWAALLVSALSLATLCVLHVAPCWLAALPWLGMVAILETHCVVFAFCSESSLSSAFWQMEYRFEGRGAPSPVLLAATLLLALSLLLLLVFLVALVAALKPGNALLPWKRLAAWLLSSGVVGLLSSLPYGLWAYKRRLRLLLRALDRLDATGPALRVPERSLPVGYAFLLPQPCQFGSGAAPDLRQVRSGLRAPRLPDRDPGPDENGRC